MKAFKAFDANLQCRGFQYEIGKTFEHEGAVQPCESGFHSCENPFDVLTYYPLVGSRFAEVELAGKIATHGDDSKLASAQITIATELRLPEFISAAARWLFDSIQEKKTGNYSAAATTGNYSAAATTGYRSAAATTGDRSAAATTGDNSAAATTGYRSAASVKGKNSIAASLGYESSASAEEGGAIMLVYYDDNYDLKHVFASLVGANGIKAGVVYRLNAKGEPEPVS